MSEITRDRIIFIVLIVLTALLFFPIVFRYPSFSDRIKEQKERIERCEQTKNSSDPVIREQAEIIKMDIEKEYQKCKYLVMKKFDFLLRLFYYKVNQITRWTPKTTWQIPKIRIAISFQNRFGFSLSFQYLLLRW